MNPLAAPATLALLLTLALAGCSGGAAETVESTIAFHFSGLREDITATVTSDLSKRPTKDDYEDAGLRHPGFYSLHDQLDDWSRASGVAYAATSFNSSFGSGFFLTSVAGVEAGGSDAYWALEVNGIAVSKGMSDLELQAGDEVAWLYTEVGGSDTDSALGLAVEPLAPQEGETARLAGQVSAPAKVSVEARRGGAPFFSRSVDAAGAWSLDVAPLPYGRSLVVVTADDGRATQRTEVAVVRLAPARVTAEFTAAVPQREPADDRLLIDVDAFLSAPAYEGKGIAHPPHANVHDVLVAWTALHPVEFSWSESFGYGVESIDGHGALSDWCYDVNGQSAPLGITGMEFKPGDEIAWHGCVLV